MRACRYSDAARQKAPFDALTDPMTRLNAHPALTMSATTHTTPAADAKPLLRWMRFLLRFVAVYNVLAGLTMLIGYHEMYKLVDVAKPQLVLPIQLVGVLVGLFGVGYWMVTLRPVENRDLMLLGFLSKGLGSILGVAYVARGTLPPVFLVVLFFADVVYLVPFWLIIRRLYRLARQGARK
jgi:hypothetical protein